MRLYVKPWVTLIWLGTLAMVLGGLTGFAAGLKNTRQVRRALARCEGEVA